MSDYQVARIGPLDDWREHFGGFDAARSRDGRRVVDHELTMQYIGMTANALVPGEQAGYWHTHARVEVEAGTVVRVGQDVWRTWRALPDSPGELRWLCIRAGGEQLPHLPDDSRRDPDRPMPWSDA